MIFFCFLQFAYFATNTTIMSDNIRINTTQNVHLNFELASLGDRLAACLIDLVLLWVFAISTLYIFSASSVSVYFVIAVVTVYFPVFEILSNGKSVGKMIQKTRVIRVDGSEPNIGDYALRGLIGLVEIFSSQGTIAMIAFLLNGKGQRIGDIAAGTTVAKIKSRVTLEQTIFEEIQETYAPTYHEVVNMTGSDIETIKKIIDLVAKSGYVSNYLLVEKTKTNIENKLGIRSQEKTTLEFLKKVVMDYNYFTGL